MIFQPMPFRGWRSCRMCGCMISARISEITHDLGNYGDLVHHSPAVDLKILSWLAERKYVVDPQTPNASLDRLKAQVEAYRLEP